MHSRSGDNHTAHPEAAGIIRQASGFPRFDEFLNLAGIARRHGDLAEAERLYRQALGIKERLLGPEHPEVATTLNNLAVVCRRRGLLDEAEALYRRAIDILARTVEPTHPALATSRNNLSRMLNERER